MILSDVSHVANPFNYRRASVLWHLCSRLCVTISVVYFLTFSLRGPLVRTQVHQLCVCDQMWERQIDSSISPGSSRPPPSTWGVGLSRSIHHSCSNFSRARRPFFTEMPLLKLLTLGLSFARRCFYFTLRSAGVQVYLFLPCSFSLLFPCTRCLLSLILLSCESF